MKTFCHPQIYSVRVEQPLVTSKTVKYDQSFAELTICEKLFVHTGIGYKMQVQYNSFPFSIVFSSLL